MAYVAGDTILATEYNTFVNSSSSPFGYNHFAGTGSGVHGLGQTAIPTVSSGAGTITASQWNTLFTGMDNIANHTNDTLTTRTQVSAGDTIAIKAAVEADLATLAASVAGGCTGAVIGGGLTLGTSLQTITTASEGWDNTATHEHSITWSSADQMRWFFNAGGKVRIVTSTTQASTNPKDQAFIDLGTALGNIDIGAQATTRSGSGESPSSGGSGLTLGFHDLTTSYQELIILTSDNSAYTSNTVQISAKLDAAPGTSVTMVIKMVASDPAGDQQYDNPNFDGVAPAINDTPRMVTNLFAITPNTSEGLSVVYAHSTVGNESNPTGTTT